MIDQHMVQTVMNMQQAMDQSMGNGVKMDVLDVDGQGNMRIRCTYNWSRFKRTRPDGGPRLRFVATGDPTGGAERFAALLGEGYTVRISPKGDVLDVNGVEEMQAAVRKKVPAGTDLSIRPSALAHYPRQRRHQGNDREVTDRLSRQARGGGAVLER